MFEASTPLSTQQQQVRAILVTRKREKEKTKKKKKKRKQKKEKNWKKKKVEIYLYVLYSQLAFPFPSRKGGGRGGSVLVFFHQEEADSPSNLYLFFDDVDPMHNIFSIFSNPPRRLVQSSSTWDDVNRNCFGDGWSRRWRGRSKRGSSLEKKNVQHLGVFLFSGGIHFFPSPGPSVETIVFPLL